MLTAGCATTTESGNGRDKAALVIAQGGIGDESYNDLALRGFESATAEHDVEGSPIESEQIVAQGEQILRRAATTGFGLVIDLEFSHGEVLPTVAAEHPDVRWAILNTEVTGENVLSIMFAEHEGSYLAGALAALMTTQDSNPKINPDKKIGVIGGTKSVGIDKFVSGYVQGARETDPEVEVLVKYSNTFGDPATGKQLASAMYDQGADIVFQVAGGTGSGVIQEAADAGRYAIGVDTNQDDLAPGHVLTSMVKRSDQAVARTVRMFAENRFPGGETIHLGLSERGVGLTDFAHTKQDIPQRVRARIDALREEIVSGERDVWNVVDQGYPSWLAG
ncbi:BMP family lipoprotein [Amycolatopsis aidingensis]|uniref:BMP family lipoprotein n=1 Tax=Amycolatopsis aidingensis TaxID=2842453 RepID=UPI001C0C0691|nr:BMP family ABC transporter substrate-binding protein [Amycolatopsis aidingensis]